MTRIRGRHPTAEATEELRVRVSAQDRQEIDMLAEIMKKPISDVARTLIRMGLDQTFDRELAE